MIQWDASLETGDSTVDSQHRELVGMFGELHAAAVDGRGKDAIEEILGRLVAYVDVHFRAEQELMMASGFPAVEFIDHLQEHTRLTDRTGEMVRQHRDGEMVTVLPLAAFLQEWITDHIKRYDRGLVEHLRAGAA